MFHGLFKIEDFRLNIYGFCLSIFL
jgi:hypothetical protein